MHDLYSTNDVLFEALFDDTEAPSRATEHSAGYDVCAYVKDRQIDMYNLDSRKMPPGCFGASALIPPGWTALVPLGFKAELPSGYEAQVRPRSGLALKTKLRIPNAPGTIDADYPNEWMVLLENTADRPLEIRHGEKIAQIVFSRYEIMNFVSGRVGVTTERTGGFGSTDKAASQE